MVCKKIGNLFPHVIHLGWPLSINRAAYLDIDTLESRFTRYLYCSGEIGEQKSSLVHKYAGKKANHKAKF